MINDSETFPQTQILWSSFRLKQKLEIQCDMEVELHMAPCQTVIKNVDQTNKNYVNYKGTALRLPELRRTGMCNFKPENALVSAFEGKGFGGLTLAAHVPRDSPTEE